MSAIAENVDFVELISARSHFGTKEDAIQAFRAGKDFKGDYQVNFQLCSIRNFKPGTTVILRYNYGMGTVFVVV